MTSFRPNQAGLDAMAIGPEVRAVLKAKAEQAMAVAEGLAQDFRITGDYADSFEVTDETTELAGHSRAAAVLTNKSAHAAAVEFGNEHVHHPHRVLGKALDAISGE